MAANVGERLPIDVSPSDPSRVLQVVKSGLNELLDHVTSLKALLHLKSSLVSLMTEVDCFSSDLRSYDGFPSIRNGCNNGRVYVRVCSMVLTRKFTYGMI